ncbi:MAG: SPOR domain-containing protein, partial [Candidatus Latescibacteria bacterium]|nr:SPOR domain-containing protein [Candidatus Latescibacterota bacterium]
APPPPPPAPPVPLADADLPDFGDVTADEEFEPMAYRRRRGNGRGLLYALLAVAVLAAAAVAFLSWQSGALKLPWPDRDRSGAETPIVAIADTTAAQPDSLASAAADTLAASADSFAVAVGDTLMATTADQDEEAAASVPSPAPTGDRILRADPAPRATEPAADLAEAAADTSHRTSAWLRPSLAAGIYVHVGSFRDLDRAGHLAHELEGRGFAAQALDAEVNHERWFRVYTGPYETIEAAQTAESKLHADRLADWTMVVRIH